MKMSSASSLNTGVLGSQSSQVNKFNTRSNSKEDEICDDWEQLDQQKIEKSLQSINRTKEDDDKTLKNCSNTNQPVPFINNQFPQPAIKILKRPTSEKKLTDMVNQTQSGSASQPIKTFEQREQEYAQARLRILGSAHPEQDQPSINNTQTTNGSSIPKNNSLSSNLSNLNQTNNNNRQNLNLIRDPVGPDGTKGFQKRFQ